MNWPALIIMTAILMALALQLPAAELAVTARVVRSATVSGQGAAEGPRPVAHDSDGLKVYRY